MQNASNSAASVDDITRRIRAAKLCDEDLDLIKKTIQIIKLDRKLERYGGPKSPEKKGDPEP